MHGENTMTIPAELRSAAQNCVVTSAEGVFDYTKGKSQEAVNADIDTALDDRYTKSETYNKTELNNLITTPNQEYVTVADYASLPATGSADTIYRVSNYDGDQEQVDVTKYSEYGWDGTQYVFLSVKSAIGEVFDISAYHSEQTYADLAAALDSNNGGGVPQPLQKGGMSVKFVQSSDNKYVQYRLMPDDWSTNTNDWVIADEGVYVDNAEFIYVRTDKNKRIIIAIEKNGNIFFGYGVPEQIKNYILGKIFQLKLEKVNDIVDFIGSLLDGDKTLQQLLNEKVDKEAGKGIIPLQFCQILESEEYIGALVDKNKRIVCAYDKNGEPFWGVGVPKVIKNYIETYVIPQIPTVEDIRKHSDNIKGTVANNSIVQTDTFKEKPVAINYVRELHLNDGGGIEVLSALKRANFGMIRLTNIRTPFTEILKEYGIDILWNYSHEPIGGHVCELDENDDVVRDNDGNPVLTTAFTNYLSGLQGILSNLDGESHPWCVDTQGNPFTYRLKYFNPSNFFGEKYYNIGLTLEEAFIFYMEVYKAVKEVRKDIMVLSGSVGTKAFEENEFVEQMCDHIEPDGTRFWDCFDILDFQSYQGSIPKIPEVISQMAFSNIKRISDKYFSFANTVNFADKHVWVTETGNSYYSMGDEYRTASYIRQTLCLLSYGADKVFIFDAVSSERLDRVIGAPADSYFGLIKNNIPASYISFARNDGEYNTAISVGPGSMKSYILRNDYTIFPLQIDYYRWRQQYDVVDVLKHDGLAISGKGFTITKVSLINQNEVETIIWTGTKRINDSNDRILFDKEVFADTVYGDLLKVYVESVDSISEDWQGLVETNAYKAIQAFLRLYNTNSTIPVINVFDEDVYVASWLSSGGNTIYALWKATNRIDGGESVVSVDVSDGAEFYDMYMNKLTIADTHILTVSGYPIYVVGSDFLYYN